LEDQQSRLNKAKELLLSGGLDADDYRSIKTEAEIKILALQNTLSAIADTQEGIDKLLKGYYDKVLFNLIFLFQKAAILNRRKMIDSLFPKNLPYTSDGFWESQLAGVLKLMYNKAKGMRTPVS
jgi:hypothetical protein